MKKRMYVKRPLAAFMLLVFTGNLFLPSLAYALTSGPAQPEMKGFEPAGTADLVDAFTGDFTYNIPLMEVGGYPVNIAYHSGSGMDDEASWVGYGWSLNPGVIDRQMRGLPDDFKGDGDKGDKVIRELHMRNDITGGVNFTFQPEAFGFSTGSVNVGLQAGIFYNNKRGLGVEFGLNANAPLLQTTKVSATANTTGLSAGASVSFNSQSGASFNPSVNFSVKGKSLHANETNTAKLSLGGSFQSRAGLQAITLGASFQNSRMYKETKDQKFSRNRSGTLVSSAVSYAAQTFLPETQASYFNQSYAVSPQFGPEAWGFFAGLQLTGHYSQQQVANPVSTYNAYGFMHCNEGKNDKQGLMDFNREKDVPYFDGVPNLPVPVATPDLFMAHAQDGSAQYRAYLGGTGIFSDPDASNTGISASLGFEVGAGAGYKIGADLQASLTKSIVTKWKSGSRQMVNDKNNYADFGNFSGPQDGADASYEPVYFKRVGEPVPADGSVYDKLKSSTPLRVKVEGNIAGPAAHAILTGKDGSETVLDKKIVRDKREVRNNSFSYLTNAQVQVAGLDKRITDYYLAAGGFKPFLNKCAASTAMVLQPFKKDHHIGEITITDEAGARKIYGIPAYNIYEEDVSFSIDKNIQAADNSKGLVSYSAAEASLQNKKGIDHFYSKEIIPPYAHSFLLSGILSADYVDIKSDGITDDDLGTSVKFNYWRKTDNFQWRTPYAAGKANYNEGLKSDPMDDKGNYSYGRKELWYLHSIESKTMVAVFETGNRADALGADAMGNTDAADQNRQQYLKTISLYAKADWYKDPSTALAVKTVHFVYDYSLFSDAGDIKKGVPNNTGSVMAGIENIESNQGGKLTLKKIYFTYQGNTKGALQPYGFQYAFNKRYDWKQYDRWGNYKNVDDGNPPGVNNDYYSYSTQDKISADANAALWQLTQIITPAGDIISVQYEADDYMYVQNRKAMQMYPMAGLGSVNKSDGYYTGDKIYVQLPQPQSSDAALRATYFDGGMNDYSKNLFFKAFVKLQSSGDKYDYVSGYAEIDNINTDVKLAAGHNDIAEIKLKKIKGEGVYREYHPIAKAAWQFMRLNTPSFIYPGYNVREDLGPVQFVKALVGAIASVSELMAPFDARAEIKKLAPSIDLSKSWVRLDASSNETKKMNGLDYYAKLGGGSRVKEVSMSDEWNVMSASAAKTAVYGMLYDYSTSISLSNGEKVMASSGVASYEPMIGNEENPFHQPNKYQQKIKLGPDNAFFIDDPLCESYFPAAGVGYSKITVRNKGADGQAGATGYSLSEFYTQKDFPVIVNHTAVESKSFAGINILQILKIKKNNSRVLSQGYTIELNDMHGKAKSEKIIDRAGNELSSVYYYYKTENADAPEKKLTNEVQLLQKDGTISNAVIGRDVEMYTDMRSETSFTAGLNVMLNIDAIYVFFAIIPVPVVLVLPNQAYTGFRSAATVKIIQLYGLPDKVIRRQNGSQVTTENLAWDAGTGEVLLTRTQNEFDDPVYNLNYPSHWAYDNGMGAAYKNVGIAIANFAAVAGDISASAATAFLVSGDELLVNAINGTAKKYWINNAGTAALPKLVLIDADGSPATVNGYAVIIRSGRRNMQSMEVGGLVSLVNPVKNGRLDIGVFTKVLNANGNTYNDEWAINASNIIKTVQECPAGYLMDATGRCYKDVETIAEPAYQVNTTVVRQKNNLYSTCGTFLTNSPGAYLTGGAADPAGANKVLLTTGNVWKNGSTNCGTGTAGDEDGPLNRSGVWLAERQNNNYNNQWVGIRTKVFISHYDVTNKSADGKTGYLFLGFGSQHSIEVQIDNVVVAARNRNTDNNNTSPVRSWRIKPISVTLDRQHEIFIRVRNEQANSEAVMGVELYNNTYSQLMASACVLETCMQCNFCEACRQQDNAANLAVCDKNVTANAIWSTKCLAGKKFNYHASAAGSAITDFNPVCTGILFEDADCNLKCRTMQRVYGVKVPNNYCDLPIGQMINPYTTGLRGNWRPQKSFAYHIDRESLLPAITPGDADVIEKTDIRKSGAYNLFLPFWKYEQGTWRSQEQQSAKDLNWVNASETTAFNQQGQEIENTDALNRYSSAQFCYQQSMVTAVASNARYTDIAYDGFEDYDFDTGNCDNTDTCNLDGHFSIRRLSRLYPLNIAPDASYAHTGRNALRVTGGAADASIVRPVTGTAGNLLYTFSGNTMLLSGKGILSGFAPQAGRQYLLSAWIKDDGNNVQQGPAIETAKAAVEVMAGGQVFNTVKAGPAVEGWRKVEVVFRVPAATTEIKIRFRPGSRPAWFDDIRIHPFDAQLKTYAYDNRSMRLWAELDENNFATFYEYDDAGILIRIKKETERGIMTIKEIRSVYKMK
ncbi:MAG: hypothetical protein ABIQ88_16605 [Chitinophagaceae bacterium]